MLAGLSLCVSLPPPAQGPGTSTLSDPEISEISLHRLSWHKPAGSQTEVYPRLDENGGKQATIRRAVSRQGGRESSSTSGQACTSATRESATAVFCYAAVPRAADGGGRRRIMHTHHTHRKSTPGLVFGIFWHGDTGSGLLRITPALLVAAWRGADPWMAYTPPLVAPRFAPPWEDWGFSVDF